ncbi:MAG: chemotaxis protein CheW [Planctomycetaceae bacterium]|jgi:purine-binding chemotaxis protein CheW|nr:chemotaxis protein CheW [Planctomycetaceae bacterium]
MAMIDRTTEGTTRESRGANENKYLSFCLGDEQFGVEILRVREIIGLISITPLPQTPPYVKGVMNLRGRIIPVIDLRQRFGLSSAEATKETCIIVLEAGDGDGAQTVMGAVVDSVREVQDIPPSAVEPAPEFGCEIPLRYIQGMGKVKDKVVVLLDIGEVIGTRERAQIAGALKDASDRRAA